MRMDADKIKLELIEFQQNAAVKEIFLMAHLKMSCHRKASPKIFPLLADCQWKFLRCLDLRGGVGEANCPLLQATVNVELGPHLAYTSVLVLFWFSVVFLLCREYFLVI